MNDDRSNALRYLIMTAQSVQFTIQDPTQNSYFSLGTVLNGNMFKCWTHCEIQRLRPCLTGVRRFVPNKGHKHDRTAQGFLSRNRTFCFTSRVVQRSVWRGQLQFWINVEVGGRPELGQRVGSQTLCCDRSPGHGGLTCVVSLRHPPKCAREPSTRAGPREAIHRRETRERRPAAPSADARAPRPLM